MPKRNKIVRDARNLKIDVTQREVKYRQKNAPDDVNDIPEDKLKCTVCNKQIGKNVKNLREPFTHVILGVLMCRSCLTFYGDGNFEMDEDGDDKFCRWCGQGGTLYVCSKCTCAFCMECIKRNISDRYSKGLDSDKWRCFICYPRPLYECRTICWCLQENARRRAEAKAARTAAAAGAAAAAGPSTSGAHPPVDIRAVPEIDPNIPTTSKGLPSMNGFRGFPSPSRSSSPFDPEHGFQGFDYDETNTNGFRGFPSPSRSSSPFDPEHGFRGFDYDETSRGSSLDPEHGFRGMDYPTTSNDEANTKMDEDMVVENDINIESAEIVKDSSPEQPVKLAEDAKQEDEEVKPDEPPKVDEEMSQEDRSEREAPKEKEEPEKMEVSEEPERERLAPVEEKPSPRHEAAMEEAATLPEPKEDSRPSSPLLRPVDDLLRPTTSTGGSMGPQGACEARYRGPALTRSLPKRLPASKTSEDIEDRLEQLQEQFFFKNLRTHAQHSDEIEEEDVPATRGCKRCEARELENLIPLKMRKYSDLPSPGPATRFTFRPPRLVDEDGQEVFDDDELNPPESETEDSHVTSPQVISQDLPAPTQGGDSSKLFTLDSVRHTLLVVGLYILLVLVIWSIAMYITITYA